MSDNSSNKGKPKGLDLSKLKMENNDGESPAAYRLDMKQFQDLALQKALADSTLHDLGGVPALQEAMRVANSLQNAINATGLRDIQDRLSAVADYDVFSKTLSAQRQMQDLLPDIQLYKSSHASVIHEALASVAALPEPWRDIYGLSSCLRLAEEMRRQQAVYLQPVRSLVETHNQFAADIFQSIHAIKLPRLDITKNLGVSPVGEALSKANVFQSLGLSDDYDAQMGMITSTLSRHLEQISAAQAAMESIFPSNLTDTIENLLTRSLEAQQAMLAEYRESAKSAASEARVNRRIATIGLIIDILMFFMIVAVNIEDRMTDEDAVMRENTEAVRENTEAVRQMKHSFDEIAAQMQRMNEIQGAVSEQDRATDVVITDLLKVIGESLDGQMDIDNQEIPTPESKKRK